MAASQYWSGENSRRISERIVVEADLVLETPALLGNGDSDDLTDMPLLTDIVSGNPLLTGATLAGALRAYLEAHERGYREAAPRTEAEYADSRKRMAYKLFGASKGDDNGLQSALIVDDAVAEQAARELRDGVRIDPATRTADDGKLFDMEAWQAGTTFPLRLELLLAQPRDDVAQNVGQYHADLKAALHTALQGLASGTITLGGRKTRGFGRISTKNWRAKAYRLTTADGLSAWLREGNQPLPTSDAGKSALDDLAVFQGAVPIADRRDLFRLEATFALDGSLLIRSNGQPGAAAPDMTHLTNGAGKPILPGTSVAGALRARATRILRLFHSDEEANKRLGELFGTLAKTGDSKGTVASKLTVEETIIAKPQFDLVQNRVAIDRFTGGAFESALFNEKPVFGTSETRLQINLTVRNPKAHDVGLLLLLLKDLWTGDLPLGGEISVGRGRLDGRHARLVEQHWDKEYEQQTVREWTLSDADGQLNVSAETRTDLETFVRAVRE